MQGEQCTLSGSLQPSRNEFVLLFCNDHFELKPVSFSAIGMQELKPGADRKRLAEPSATDDTPAPKRLKLSESEYSLHETSTTLREAGSIVATASAPPIAFAMSAKPKSANSALPFAPSTSAAPTKLGATTSHLHHPASAERSNTVIDDPDSDDSDSSE